MMEEHPVDPKEGSPAGTGPAHHHVLRNLRPSGRWLRGVCIAAVVLGSVTSPRAGELTIRQIGAWGGSVDAIHVEEVGDQRIAYIGSGVNLVILDVTDPANIIELGSAMLEALIRDIVVRDGHAYIGTMGGEGLCVVDVSNPAAPEILWRGVKLDIYDPGYDEIRLLGDRVYTSYDFGGPGICADIGAPASAPELTVDCTEGHDTLLISGNYGYMASINAGGLFWITDLASSARAYPPIVGRVIIPELMWGARESVHMALSEDGRYAYVTGRGDDEVSRVMVVDISVPETPVVAGIWTDDLFHDRFHYTTDVAVSGERVYVVDWSPFDDRDPNAHLPQRSLVILDLSDDPTSPRALGEYWIEGGAATELSVVGTTVYLQEEREGLIILDCSDPGNIVRLGGYFSPAVFQQGALGKNTLYVTDERFGVTFLDVTDPRRPALAGRWETGTTAHFGIEEREDLVYVAAGWAGLQVLDVTDPATPGLAGEYPFPLCVRALDLALAANVARVGVRDCSLRNFLVEFDISKSNLPEIRDMGSLQLLERAPYGPKFGMATKGDMTYLGLYSRRMTVYSSPPNDPLSLGCHPRRTLDLELDGNLLYLAAERTGYDTGETEPGGLYIVNVANPLMQWKVGAAVLGPDEGWGFTSVAVHDGRIAFAGRYGGLLYVYDVSDPTQPAPLACRGTRSTSDGHACESFNRPKATMRDLIVDGRYLYGITSHSQQLGGGVIVYLFGVPGDFDDDGDVDLRDYATLQRCFSGGAALPPGRPGADCLVYDFDEDDDVDGADYAAFRLEATEPR